MTLWQRPSPLILHKLSQSFSDVLGADTSKGSKGQEAVKRREHGNDDNWTISGHFCRNELFCPMSVYFFESLLGSRNMLKAREMYMLLRSTGNTEKNGRTVSFSRIVLCQRTSLKNEDSIEDMSPHQNLRTACQRRRIIKSSLLNSYWFFAYINSCSKCCLLPRRSPAFRIQNKWMLYPQSSL